MPEQQYEYRQLDLDQDYLEDGGLEDKLNELAEDGWVLDERYTWSGATHAYILRRPIE